ncbi:hypothetical protein RB628_32670 [Streptomyces sp. ADMS]|uniref:hypothetical protein n=1 Tax=Streptomyces sp. ADMS TaxID=3071415 RepID=UPI00296F2CDD|nr:hypothetical protein [Streptomyces sp. ADMS]MDW4909958.1 hypothetical protein [Streptomyces sp. ADMS]
MAQIPGHVRGSSDAEGLNPDVVHGGVCVRDPRTGKLRFAGFGGLLAVLGEGRWVCAEYQPSAEDTDVWIHDIGTGSGSGSASRSPADAAGSSPRSP